MTITYDEETDLGHISNGQVQQDVQFQHGLLGEDGQWNGVTNEEVIELLLLRLRAFQVSFPCAENAHAITKIEEARLWLEERTAIRVNQGVESTHQPHTSPDDVGKDIPGRPPSS